MTSEELFRNLLAQAHRQAASGRSRQQGHVRKPLNAKQSADGKWYWVEIGPPETDSKIELTEKLR